MMINTQKEKIVKNGKLIEYNDRRRLVRSRLYSHSDI